MNNLKKYILLISTLIFGLIWFFVVSPAVLNINTKTNYEVDVVSVDNFYDINNQDFLGEQYSKTEYNFSTKGKKGRSLEIVNTFDVKSLSGKQIFKASPTYIVNPHTRLGYNTESPSQTGYVFPPKNLKKGQGFDYWHVTSKDVISMKYLSTEKINGLTVYKYEKREQKPDDQTEVLGFLPDVPEKKGVRLISNIYMWVEPVSGYLVKLEDFSIDYHYYDIKTGEKLYPYNQFLNTYSQESLNELVNAARYEKYKHVLVLWVAPTLLFLVFLLILFSEKILNSKRVAFLTRHYKTILLVFVVIASFGLISYYIYQRNIEQRNLYFDEKVRESNLLLDKQINIYIGAILGGKGLFESSDYVSQSEWRTYVGSIDPEKNYPGVQGLGFSTVFDASESAKFISEQQKVHGQNFRVYPESEKEFYTSIIYLEPQNDRNQKAIGYDMYTEPIRRYAMNKAISTALPSMSGKVTLVQETENDIQPGFLIYVPIFKNQKITGFVYSPFRARNLVDSIFQNIKTDLTFKIYDGLKMQPENLIYDRHPGVKSSEVYTKISTIYIAGHAWTIEYKNSPEYNDNFLNFMLPYIIFFLGILISFLLWIALYSLGISEEKAVIYAKQANQELEISKQNLIAKNKELEEKIAEANSLNRLMVGRELKMIDLKRKIDEHYD